MRNLPTVAQLELGLSGRLPQAQAVPFPCGGWARDMLTPDPSPASCCLESSLQTLCSGPYAPSGPMHPHLHASHQLFLAAELTGTPNLASATSPSGGVPWPLVTSAHFSGLAGWRGDGLC